MNTLRELEVGEILARIVYVLSPYGCLIETKSKLSRMLALEALREK